MKKIVFVDMDGVIADFSAALINIKNDPDISEQLLAQPDLIEGIFEKLPLISGAKQAINKLHLSNKYDLFIATTAPWNNPGSWRDKRLWIEQNFGDLFKKKMFVTHRKDLLNGHYLIDDRLANGAGKFQGNLIQFGWNYELGQWNEYPNWESVLALLL